MGGVDVSIIQIYSESGARRERSIMPSILLELAQKSVQSTIIYWMEKVWQGP